jgi:predicted AlkP superfamily phosphohydrolase/phosphomutase
MASPVVVVGLDGATLDLWRFVDESVTPTIAAFLEEGVSAPLSSTAPPGSAPAWPSIVTGVNPGKHGIFGFVERRGYDAVPVRPDYDAVPTLWRELSARGASSVFLNVPLTYPPESVEDGVVVSSMLTPPDGDWASPPEVQAELASVCTEGYVVDTNVEKEATPAANVAHLRRAARARTEAAVHLLADREPDLLFTVYTGLDRLQHDFWVHLDPEHAHHGERGDADLAALAREYLAELDDCVAEVLDAAPADATVVLLSDHGFGALERYLNVNNWLAREGYLALEGAPTTRARRVLHRAGLNPRNAYRALSALGLAGPARRRSEGESLLSTLAGSLFLTPADIDWERTRAFSLGVLGWGPIYVNRRDREPRGRVAPGDVDAVRAELAEDLREWTDPATGEPVVRAVHRREELYGGGHRESAPDLLFEPAPGYTCFVDHEFASPAVVEDGFGISGEHRRAGVLGARGPAVDAAADLAGASPGVLDVAPTLLHLLGHPVPRAMDGRVLDVFAADSEPADRDVRETAATTATGTGGEWSDAEAAAVRDTLEDIGYL